MNITNFFVVRMALAALLAIKVFEVLFATVLTAAYRLNNTRLTEGLGSMTPGDNYNRLIPLMEAIPWWLHGLMILAAILYLIAIVRVLLGMGRAQIPVLAAVVVELIAQMVGRPIIAATGVMANPNPSILASLILPFVLPLLLAMVLAFQSPTAKPASS